MLDDESAIRKAIADWMCASCAGDVEAVLALMTEDVVFSVCGQTPFGKARFAEASRAMAGVAMEGEFDILELEVHGDWAFTRTHLAMTMTPPGRASVRRVGYTLSLWRREADGAWRLARDANLMPVSS